MNMFISQMFGNVKQKKGYALFLMLLGLTAIILGIVAVVNFGDVTIDLTHIAYIKFLRGGGVGGMFFGMFLSVSIFFLGIVVCHLKKFLIPLGLVFYFYLVYSQTVVFVSIITIYGFFNCVILAMYLMVYFLLLWAVFIFFMCEIIGLSGCNNYFKTCFSFRESKVFVWFIFVLILTLLFSLILVILKKFVILLIFE